MGTGSTAAPLFWVGNTKRHDKPGAMTGGNRDEVDEGSGNVFADLDLPDPAVMLAKAELARRIGDIVAERKLTQ
jgi:hypothetical protein